MDGFLPDGLCFPFTYYLGFTRMEPLTILTKFLLDFYGK